MQNQAPNALVQLFPLIFLIILFYFLLLRPQRKKQLEHERLIKSLKKNDEIVTIGGIHGVIVNVKEKTFVIRVDDNVKIEIDKNSIGYLKKRHKEEG